MRISCLNVHQVSSTIYSRFRSEIKHFSAFKFAIIKAVMHSQQKVLGIVLHKILGCLNQTKNLNADTLLWDVI